MSTPTDREGEDSEDPVAPSDRSDRAVAAAETALPVIADAAVTGTVSIGGGGHGVGLLVDAADLVAALGATVADVTEVTGMSS